MYKVNISSSTLHWSKVARISYHKEI